MGIPGYRNLGLENLRNHRRYHYDVEETDLGDSDKDTRLGEETDDTGEA